MEGRRAIRVHACMQFERVHAGDETSEQGVPSGTRGGRTGTRARCGHQVWAILAAGEVICGVGT